MGLLSRLRRAVNAAKAPVYTELGETVAQAASNVSIAVGIGGGAPLTTEKQVKQA